MFLRRFLPLCLGLKERFWSAILAASLLTATFFPTIAVGQTPLSEDWQKSHRQLAELNARQKAVLAELFQYSLQIQTTREHLQALEVDRKRLDLEKTRLERELRLAEEEYQSWRTKAGRGLRLLQELGPASYLQVLLAAQSLGDFLERWRLVERVLQGSARLLAELKGRGQVLAEKERRLASKQQELALVRARKEQELSRLTQVQKEKEDFLRELGAEKGFYQERLAGLEKEWATKIRPFIEKLDQRLASLSQQVSDLPGAEMALTGDGMNLKLSQDALNSLWLKAAGLPEAAFVLEDNQVKILVPGLELTLLGTFVLDGNQALRYQVNQVEVAGLAVSTATQTDLFAGHPLRLDLSAILGPFQLKTVAVTREGVNLVITPRVIP
ncbi:MAG: hypothetical protein M1553_01310 [Firmicutes bacterium]|nr:hypothetical protein [Bacillota bacterium]